MKYQYLYLIAAILVIVLILWIWVLFRRHTALDFSLKSDKFVAKTAEFSVLKKVLQDKINLVKEKSGLLTPYNPGVMDALVTAARNATTLEQLGMILILLPNNCIGTAPIGPLSGSPEDTTLFQFEQGSFGWYWGYATFLNSKPSNIMYYIVRLEFGTPEIRAKYNLPLGATTAYYISVGVGRGKQNPWSYSPYVICRGTYTALDKTNFTFQCGGGIECPVNLTFSGDNNGFQLAFNCEKGSNGDTFSAAVNLMRAAPARFNAPKGCAPCIYGTGTLYWSYPRLQAQNGKISFDTINSGLLSGDGWLDHQWMRGNDSNLTAINIVTTLTQLSKFVGGLGRYMWINIHLKDGIEYNITAFPSLTNKISKGETYPAQYRMYGKGQNTVYDSILTTIKLLDTTTITDPGSGENIIYPTIFSIDINDNNYVIDTTPYGDCVTIDLSNNLHWSGSATLTSPTDKNTSSAFVELNQFQDVDMYTGNMLKMAGVPAALLTIFTGPPLKFHQAIPAILVLLLGSTLLILPILFLAIGVNTQFLSKKTSK